MTKDDLRLKRSTSKVLERVQVKLMRNFLFFRSSDDRIVQYRKQFNLLEFV